MTIDHTPVPGTLDELLGLVAEHSEWITTCLKTRHTSWMPHVAVLTRDSPGGPGGLMMYALSIPFNELHEKHEALRNIGRTLYAEQRIPVVAVMSSEAWVSPDPGPGKQPADHPERREAIIVAGSTLGMKHMALRRLFVTRGDADRLVPGEFEPVITEGVVTKLLNQLWAGFFEVVMQKYGDRLGTNPRPGG